MEKPEEASQSGLVEAWAESRSQRFNDTIRCIGCILARPEDGRLINAPAIIACLKRTRTGIYTNSVYRPLNELVEEGFLEPCPPDELPETQAWGRRKPSLIQYFKPTPLGAEVFPVQTQEDCETGNPFLQLTANQERILRCMRCVFSKTDEAPEQMRGGATAQQVSECQKVLLHKVSEIFRLLMQGGFVGRTTLPPMVAARGRGSNIYRPTPKGAVWLTPKPAAGCPTNTSQVAPAEFTSKQESVLKCIACMHNTLQSDPSQDPIRVFNAIRCTRLTRHVVGQTFKKLFLGGYLAKEINEGGTRPKHYHPTASGERLLASVTPPLLCSLNRRSEISSLATRSPIEILKGQPPRTFANGHELVNYLEMNLYGERTLLQILNTALVNSTRRRAPSYGAVSSLDITQQVMLVLTEWKKTIVFPGEALKLVFRIAANKNADAFRHLRRRPADYMDEMYYTARQELEAKSAYYEPGDPTDKLAAQEAVKFITTHFKLTPVQHTILEFMAFGSFDPATDNINAAEIALLHNTTEVAVRVAKHRFLKKLRSNRALQALWLDLNR